MLLSPAQSRIQTLPIMLSVLVLLVVLVTTSLSWRTIPAPQIPTLEALPLAFVPNEGQFDERVRWHTQGHGGMLSFYQNSVGLRFSDDSTVTLRWEGANPAPTIASGDRLEGVVNYIYGNDATQWHTNVPTHDGLYYHDLYPGISLAYVGTDGVLKGTYTVAAGVAPSLIRWQFEGASRIEVMADTGDLRVTLPNGRSFLEQAPIAWQDVNGQRRMVATQYGIEGNTVHFAFPDGYDATHPLVIDPTLLYSTYLGEISSDYIRDLSLDNAGNIYVVGHTYSDNLGGFPNTVEGFEDAFVGKLNAAGTAWQWVTYLGGSEDETGYGIAADGQGNVWMTGSTESSDFPTTANADDSTFGGFDDVVVVRLNSNTGAMTYGTYFGDEQLDEGRDIALDTSGNAYITGQVHQANVLALKYTGAANPELVYGVQWGDERGHDIGYGVAVDDGGRMYIAGMTENAADPWGSTFPLENPIQASCGLYDNTPDNCTPDAFISILNAEGNALVYSTLLGGGGSGAQTSGRDEAYDIALDGSGNMIVTGTTYAYDFPTHNAAYENYPDDSNLSDAWVTKISADGQSFIYSTYLGGEGSEEGQALVTDGSGNVFVLGFTQSEAFPVLNPIQGELEPGGYCANGSTVRRCYDAFLTKFTATGQVGWSTYLGGSQDEYGMGIDRHSNGDLVVAGYTESNNFPVTGNATQPEWAGNEDGFISKISEQSAPPATATPTTAPSVTPGGPTITPTSTLQATVTPGGPTVTPTATPNPNLKKTFLPIVSGRGE